MRYPEIRRWHSVATLIVNLAKKWWSKSIRAHAKTSETGFHLVDEAAPPAGLRSLAKRLVAENLTILWWGNIRFEKTFTPELCQLLTSPAAWR